MRSLVFVVSACLMAASLASAQQAAANPEERHLANIRQLTSVGENAEAYFSMDGTKLAFQSTHPPYTADQIFTMNIDGSDMRLVSTGKGRTTCAYWFPNGKELIYASTHLGGDAPPPPADRSKGYVWPIYATYDIFRCQADGSGLTRLTDSPGYDAEGSVSPDGRKIAYTSVASGDLEIWTMNADGSGKTQITHSPGYDGGPFFSWDGKWICYRSNRPKGADLTQYLDLLARQLVGPFDLDLRIVPAEGGEPRTVIELPGSQFCPFFHPDGKRLIFASNHAGSVMEFDLWLVNVDGTGLEQVTYEPGFDGFPMFSADAKHLVWASNRHGAHMGDTNIFIADWVE